MLIIYQGVSVLAEKHKSNLQKAWNFLCLETLCKGHLFFLAFRKATCNLEYQSPNFKWIKNQNKTPEPPNQQTVGSLAEETSMHILLL